MAFYLFRAVEEAGLYNKTAQLWEPWREMLRNNLTTCEEDQVNRRSDCHAWGALALYELPAVILGVQPAEPGYRTVRVKPNPAYLQWAKGSMKTPHGIVTVAWKMVEGKLNVQIDSPDGIKVITE